MPFRRALNRLRLKEARRKMKAIRRVEAAKKLVLKPGGHDTPLTARSRRKLTQAKLLLAQRGLINLKPVGHHCTNRAGDYLFHWNVTVLLEAAIANEEPRWNGLSYCYGHCPASTE